MLHYNLAKLLEKQHKLQSALIHYEMTYHAYRSVNDEKHIIVEKIMGAIDSQK